jgi:hypothetical protein
VVTALRVCQSTLFLIASLLPGALPAYTADTPDETIEDPSQRIQVVEDRITTSGLQLYRVTDLERGETLYVHVSTTSGCLDPLVALLKPEVDLADLSRESFDALVSTLSRNHDPIEVTRQILDRYTLAGNDDFEGDYAAAFNVDIPTDGGHRHAAGRAADPLLPPCRYGPWPDLLRPCRGVDRRSAPDFDMRDFPFDVQTFFIRIDLLTPVGCSCCGRSKATAPSASGSAKRNGWSPTSPRLSQAEILQRPVSRFDFEFRARRHIDY